jgi:type I restriction enzyme S subunit
MSEKDEKVKITEERREVLFSDITVNYDKMRKPLSSRQRDERHGIYPYYGAQGIIDYIDGYIFDGEYLLIAEDGENLFSLKTPIAQIAHGKFWVNNHAHIVTSNGYSDLHFIYYLINHIEIAGYISGSVQPKLSQSSLNAINLFIPSLTVQKAIVKILSSLDDKIDLLHRQNKTLEALAETLFRKWFVEDGDEQKLISDYVDFNPQRILPKGSTAPYLEMSNANTDTFHPVDWYDREYSSGMKFINGDTLLARITPCLENGKASYITFLGKNQAGWGSTEFIVLRPKVDIHPLFAYALVKNRDFRDYAEGCLEGSSGRQRVNVDHLMNFEINALQKEVICEFNGIMESIEPKLVSNFMEIRTLERLRDTLLPKLMSGEMRVK